MAINFLVNQTIDNTIKFVGSGENYATLKMVSQGLEVSVGDPANTTNPLVHFDGAYERVLIGSTTAANTPYLRIGGAGNQSSRLELTETTTGVGRDMNYGFSFNQTGNVSNTLEIKRHSNSTAGTNVITLARDNSNVTFAGDITVSGGDITLGGTGRIQGVDTVSANTDAANKLYVDNAISGVPQGDITNVIAGTGMTGGGSSGSVTLNVIGSDGITANADNIVVDSTVVRTSGTQSIGGAKTFSDNVTISGATKNLFIFNTAETQAGVVFGDAQGETSQRAAIKFDSGTETLDFFVNDEAAERMSINTSGVLTLVGGQIVLGATGRIQGIDNVIASTDAANKAYVDAKSVGILTLASANGITVTGGTTANATVGVNYTAASNNLVHPATTISSLNTGTSYGTYFLCADSNPGITYGAVSKIRTGNMRLNDFGNPDGSVSMNAQKITNVATPTATTDAANKAYVDANSSSLSGSGAGGRVTIWSGTNILSSDAQLLFDTSTNKLTSTLFQIPNNGDYLGTDTSGNARTLISLTSGNDVEVSNSALTSGSDTIIYFGDNFRVKDGSTNRLSISSNGTMSNFGNTFNSGPINLDEGSKIVFDDDGDQWNYIYANGGSTDMAVGGTLTLINIEENIFGDIKLENIYSIINGPTSSNATFIPVYTDSASSTVPRLLREQTPTQFLSNAGAITGSGTSGRVAFFTGTRTQSSDTLYWSSSNNVLGINYSGTTFNSGALQIQGPTTSSGGIGMQIYNSTSGSPYGAHGIYVNGPRYGNAGISIKNPNVGSTFMRFYSSSGSTVGTITQSGSSSTSFNTSSDYRLKENIIPMTGSIDRLKKLKPSKFNFIDQDVSRDATITVDGFIAHEVSDIIPEAITGEKDGVDYKGDPEYQSIDQSKIVPLLTSALQEAVAKIESLEARLKLLES